MKPHILIVGQVPDPHIETVAQTIENFGAQAVIFNRLQPQAHRLNFNISNDGHHAWLECNGQYCDLSHIRSVWWRVKPYTISELSAQPDSITAGFIDREWRSALDSLSAFTDKALWVNPRAADFQARNKPFQLAVASQVGMRVPSTLVSNDPDEIVKFMDSGSKEHIYKALTWYIEPPDKMLYTAAVNADQVGADNEALQVAACIFQERIPKAYEVRATVVGELVFAARIKSQEVEAARLDWRKAQAKLEYKALFLPSEINNQLIEMNRRLGLHFGAYDLIITPDDDAIFLEVNPLGQWLWLERATGLPVSQTLAEYLIRGERDNS